MDPTMGHVLKSTLTERALMRDRLLSIVDAFPKQKTVVFGDLIADEFLYGQISRVSREAPVLVLQYRDLVRLPGGAANAANNLLDLGCRVRVFGAVGPDKAGRDLVRMLSIKGANVRHIVEVESYTTPVKTRILAGAYHSAPQQVVRVDRMTMLEATFQQRWGPLRRAALSSDALIVSDYGYGAVTSTVFAKLRAVAKPHGLPLVVDSRFDMGRFEGVTAITPNITELEASTGISIGSDTATLARISRDVLRKQKLDYLLVTQGRFGMTLFQPRRPPLHVPIFGTDEVADVTGAGDTVIAVFTLALASGGSAADAARLANYAGGIVVMKRGTATVTQAELRAAIKQDFST